ncbi:hypothetical protein MJD09_05940 [bacterium]|nr:hypothetical protein [bacterium]
MLNPFKIAPPGRALDTFDLSDPVARQDFQNRIRAFQQELKDEEVPQNHPVVLASQRALDMRWAVALHLEAGTNAITTMCRKQSVASGLKDRVIYNVIEFYPNTRTVGMFRE